jgi:ribosomal-protein-alanine N-acetyltransferase
LKLAVVPMDLDDIPQVIEVDRESYTLPWPASAYRREILHNRNARYYVLRDGPHDAATSPGVGQDQRARSPFSFFRWPARAQNGDTEHSNRILGYAGMWLMVDEGHITTIAMREEWRGRGLGELLLACLIDAAQDLGIARMTLEVRVSNTPAQTLYRKYGFEEQGVRPRYYSDNNEDAYIMSTGDIQAASYVESFGKNVEALKRRLVDGQAHTIAASPFNSSPEVGRAEVE